MSTGSVQHVHGKGGCAGKPARDILVMEGLRKGVQTLPLDKPSSGVGLPAGACKGRLKVRRGGEGLHAGWRGEITTP